MSLCFFGRHAWFVESDRRNCQHCAQIEISRHNIHGEGSWEITSKGNFHQVTFSGVAAVSGWSIAAIFLAILVAKIWNADQNREPTMRPEFVGISWEPKSNSMPVGPGPNLFSDRNVSVDDDGNLHLQIRKIAGRWSTAEVDSGISFGYGTYSFTLGSVPQEIDENVVLGFFTWDEDPDQHHREIDIEFHQRNVGSDVYSGAFVVQPWDEPGNIQEFQTKPSPGFEFSFRWSFNKVEYFVRDSGGTLVETWTYTGLAVPEPGNESVRINLWLANGTPPANLHPVEIVLDDFTFHPLQ